MSNVLLKSIIMVLCLGYLSQIGLFAQKNDDITTIQGADHLVEEYDTALSVISATMTPILSGEMGRGMDQLYSFTLLVKRSGSYRFPTIWINGQSYPLILGNIKGEQLIHNREDKLTLNIMVSPNELLEQTDPLPEGKEHRGLIGLIKAVDGKTNFYIPILSITPLSKVIIE